MVKPLSTINNVDHDEGRYEGSGCRLTALCISFGSGPIPAGGDSLLVGGDDEVWVAAVVFVVARKQSGQRINSGSFFISFLICDLFINSSTFAFAIKSACKLFFIDSVYFFSAENLFSSRHIFEEFLVSNLSCQLSISIDLQSLGSSEDRKCFCFLVVRLHMTNFLSFNHIFHLFYIGRGRGSIFDARAAVSASSLAMSSGKLEVETTIFGSRRRTSLSSEVGIDVLTSYSRSPLSTGGTCTVEVSSTITSVAVVDDSGAFLDRLVGLFEGLALRFSGTFLFFFSTGPFDGSGAFEDEASFVV
nr:hypothetical protein Iba_chr12bCG16280 [Ipomoea batatas]